LVSSAAGMDSDTNDGRQTMEVPVIKINDHESDENEYEMLLDDTEEYTRLAAPSPNDPSDGKILLIFTI